MELADGAVVVLDDLVALDDVGVLEAHFSARLQAEELLRRLFHEVFLLDVDDARERHVAVAAVHRIVVGDEHFLMVFRHVRQHDLQRMQHGHDAVGMLVEIFAHSVLEHRDIDEAVCLCNADFLAERFDSRWRIAATAQARDGRHARVVPAAHIAFFDELAELALARDRIREVQARELNLARARHRVEIEGVEEPVIERTVLLEFERADGIRDALDGIGQRMREVVHRIDAPLVARAVMRCMRDAVDDRVAHDHVRRRHVDFRAQDFRAVCELAGLHATEEIEVFLNRTISVRAFLARLRQRAAICLDFLGREVVDIGEAFLDELFCKVIELVEVVRSVELAVAPAEAEPADVVLDGIDVLDIFLRRIRVVEAQVAEAAILFGEAEVQADGLRMADMQVAVRLGWESRVDACRIFAVLEVFVNLVLDEVRHDVLPLFPYLL